jgi:hypothetical protein
MAIKTEINLFSWNSWKHNYENDVITSAVGNWYTCITKTWKIPKKFSEAVKRRTDITVAKRKHTTQKCIKDWATRTLQIHQNELGCRGRVSNSCSTSDTRRVSFWTKLVISHAKEKRDYDYNKMNISVVMCDTHNP